MEARTGTDVDMGLVWQILELPLSSK